MRDLTVRAQGSGDMEIMGRWNWWLPKPVARVLPRPSFESSGSADRAPASA